METQCPDAQSEPVSRVRRMFVNLVACFAVIHAAYLVVQIIPHALRPKLPWRELMPAYKTLTGSEQVWDMFESIPSYEAFDATIQITSRSGEIRELGPVMPGMRKYRDLEGPRLHCVMDRMTWVGKFHPFQLSYLKKMDEVLKERDLLDEGDVWTLRYDLDYIRHLFHVRKDGQVSLRKVKEFSPPMKNPPSQ